MSKKLVPSYGDVNKLLLILLTFYISVKTDKGKWSEYLSNTYHMIDIILYTLFHRCFPINLFYKPKMDMVILVLHMILRFIKVK